MTNFEVTWNAPFDWRCEKCEGEWYARDLIEKFKHFCPFCKEWYYEIKRKEVEK